MPDIYDILAKHFLNETSKTEEQPIAEFKKNYPTEYSLLSDLWEKGDIKVKNFDSQKAWNTIQTAAKKKRPTKIVPLYQKFRHIAAAVAFIIVGAFSVYYYINFISDFRTVVEQADNTEKGKEILLSDGSKVWLNENASLTYAKIFSTTERKVKLDGEAFFEVTKNPGKPFIIATSNSSVRVLGTSFNINSNEEKTEVTVATGKVEVSDANDLHNVVITPGYTANVSGTNVEKYKTKKPNYNSWKTGAFTFEDTSIDQVIKDLNTFYQKQVVIEKGAIIDCRLTANFNQAKLQEILEIMQLTCDFSVVTNSNNYIIK